MPSSSHQCNGTNSSEPAAVNGEGHQQKSKFFHKRTAKRVELAKRKARSELKRTEWDAIGYAYVPGLEMADPEEHLDTIERVNGATMSLEEFRELYERPAKPVILTGLIDKWPAKEKWTLEKLLRGYRNQKFKCGEDDDGYSVKLKLKYYIDYATSTKDDSPLYIFDSSFGDRPKTDRLLQDYEIPVMFKDDLFRYATERRRPPYRWVVIGPARSGTSIHIDPLGTSAWNALISGHKKWCLIHPSASKQLVKPSKEEGRPHTDEAITWFHTVYPRVLSPQWPADRHPVIHAIQKPGEVMFVPSGWWHVVMNLDMAIAVTQNFASEKNLSRVWPKVVSDRSALSVHWLKAIHKERPELIPLIEAINETHGIGKLDLSEPYDSSSSSSSSDDSASESTDGEHDNSNNRHQKRPIGTKDVVNGKDHCESQLNGNGAFVSVDGTLAKKRKHSPAPMHSNSPLKQ